MNKLGAKHWCLCSGTGEDLAEVWRSCCAPELRRLLQLACGWVTELFPCLIGSCHALSSPCYSGEHQSKCFPVVGLSAACSLPFLDWTDGENKVKKFVDKIKHREIACLFFTDKADNVGKIIHSRTSVLHLWHASPLFLCALHSCGPVSRTHWHGLPTGYRELLPCCSELCGTELFLTLAASSFLPLYRAGFPEVPPVLPGPVLGFWSPQGCGNSRLQ